VQYVLIVFFACGLGCGTPTQFAQTYQSYSQCQSAGMTWLSPGANPSGAVGGYSCDAVSLSQTTSGAPSNVLPPTPQFSSSTTLFERSRNVLPSDATPADRNVLPSDTTTADPRTNEDWRQREEIAKQRNPNNVIDRGYVEPDQAAKAAAPQFSSSTTLFERSRNVLPSDATPADRNVLPSDTTTADPSAGRFAR
jgi:hypothetical protein